MPSVSYHLKKKKKNNNNKNKNAPSFPELQNATDAIPGVKCPSNKTRNEEEEEEEQWVAKRSPENSLRQ